MYKISNHYEDKEAKELWVTIINRLKRKEVQIESIRKKKYNIVGVNAEVIIYQSESRNNKEPEEIYKSECIDFLKVLIREKEFNTNSIKKQISSPLYRKRSPMFAILLYTGIIEEM